VSSQLRRADQTSKNSLASFLPAAFASHLVCPSLSKTRKPLERRSSQAVSLPPGRRPTWIVNPRRLNTPKSTLPTRTNVPGSSYERSTDQTRAHDPKTTCSRQPLDRSTLPSRSTSSSEPSNPCRRSVPFTSPKGPAQRTLRARGSSGSGRFRVNDLHQ